MIKTTVSAVAVFALFVGSVNCFPAFAASMADIPILGTLVRTFQINASQAEGGAPTNGAIGSLTLIRTGETERLTLNFDQKEAAQYKAEYAAFPETVTLTLPGTRSVEVISEVERAKNASSYIKSVYPLVSLKEGVTRIQIEIEYTADVQISEYKNPGSIVIELTSGKYDQTPVFSARSYSFKNDDAFTKLEASFAGKRCRVLRDEQSKMFLEFAQFNSKQEAENFAAGFDGLHLIVEKRIGNNVPVCYEDEAHYQRAMLLNDYYEILIRAESVDPILAFLDEHLAGACPEDQTVMLSGLTGFIKGPKENYDTKTLEKYYQMAGQSMEQALND